MIRFRCPTCDRQYVLADALAGLPLLCKGCGHHLTPPAPEPDPPPEALASGGRQPPESSPRWADAPRSPADLPAYVPTSPPNPTPLSRPAPTDRVDLPYKGGGEKPALPNPFPAPARAVPAGRRVVGLVVDAAVVLILLAAGVVVGDMVAGRSLRDLIAQTEAAGSPPMELVLWAGPPAVFLLVYLWLGARGWTVGGWLKRRA